MTDTRTPTLIDARGMGGIIAIDGFDYQLWDCLARIPSWVSNPAFEQLIFEGLEDHEAKFFAPHSPHRAVLDRYQAKASTLQPAAVKEVFENFQSYDEAHPSTARVHTLVMPSLPASLSWFARDKNRVRKARPFYAPFNTITAANEDELRSVIASTYPGLLGEFVAGTVEVHERNMPDLANAIATFTTQFNTAFPQLDVSSRKVEAAFDALAKLVRNSVGAPVGRAILIETLEKALGTSLPLPMAFPLNVRSDRNEQDEASLELDASGFSGGDAGYPSSPVWATDLLAPLGATSQWLRRQNIVRIALKGSYRLTTAFALGWSFRSAIGFEIDIPTRDGHWPTDDRPIEGSLPDWSIRPATRLHGDRLQIAIGVIRDPTAALIASTGIAEDAVMSIHTPSALVSAKAAQASVGLIKRRIDEAVSFLSPVGIDIYFVGPAAFAVAIGHRWNAFPSTQLHEFVANKYVPTAVIDR
ncbi:SAVED domain-containing protein [Pelagibacterium flavum]|uniref:SAVED domain-containing protein n=1 Tax=Pelagibacterium flavum TaxID=2984530 RepID=A0ABY6IIV6_9HYPH|nr:SAVED domain-containing protein [Pelagibacterium sp. YIM 151497]UYQ70406.1 SAVED domain-containing protein [Pelagibacterium sp. YIM 151497]